MKNKVYLALIMAAVLSVAGCGKKEEAVSSAPEAVSSVTSEVSATVSEQEKSESPAGSVVEETGSDDTGVYPGSTGTAEADMGIKEAVCTVKLPLNYVIDGGYYDADGVTHGLDGLGSATTTVEEGMAAGSFNGELPMATFALTNVAANPTTIRAFMYDAVTQGTLEDMKGMYTDGKAIGTDAVPGWVYHKTSSGEETDFAVAMQVSTDVLLELIYKGPLDDEVGEDEAAQRIYNLVTVK